MGHMGWGCRDLPLQLVPQLKHALNSCFDKLPQMCTGLKLTERFSLACSEGVPKVVLNAGASSHVVHDSAPCIDTTSARAGVDAFVPLACFVGGTVTVNNTLWSACYVGISKVFRDTLTCSCVSSSLANCIGPTRRWITRIKYLGWFWTSQKWKAIDFLGLEGRCQKDWIISVSFTKRRMPPPPIA